eukprot:370667-Rhodomonas_salina.2
MLPPMLCPTASATAHTAVYSTSLIISCAAACDGVVSRGALSHTRHTRLHSRRHTPDATLPPGIYPSRPRMLLPTLPHTHP